ncbi:MAG: lytic transglycosylase [Nocardioidaceae bacterium]
MPASSLTRLSSVATAAVAPLAFAFADGAYVVQPGDTVSEIAAEHDTTVAAIVAANDLAAGGNLIFAGESLAIPSAHGSARAPASGQSGSNQSASGEPGPGARRLVWHTVRPGDTVSSLAVRYHAWTDEVITRNDLASSGAITVGQRLRIPVVLAALPDRERTASSGPASSGPASSGTERSGSASSARGEDALPNPSHARVRRVIERVASRYGVDPDLALAVSWQEAGWQQDHISSARAIGAMQVLPSTGAWIETLISRDLDLRRLPHNVTAGVVLLRELVQLAPLPRAVAGYYQGLQAVRDHGMFTDTKQYVRNVLYLQKQYHQGHYPY